MKEKKKYPNRKVTDRCEKHKIFIPSSGCKICKEIAEIRTDFENRIIDKNLEIIELKKQINDLEANKIPAGIKHAVSYMNRNERQAVINIYGAQSLLVAIIQHIRRMPDTPRKKAIQPLFDYVFNMGDKLDDLCNDMCVKMEKEVGNIAFNDMIADCSTMVDILGGEKMRGCLSCMKYLDRKAENKKAIREEIQNKA